jgi:hypothetical protein
VVAVSLLIQPALGALPASSVEGLIGDHVASLIEMIDAQADGGAISAHTALAAAMDQVAVLVDTIAPDLTPVG